jgi:hypothetical protein
MSEIDMNRINAEIEEQIKMCASNIELANDETVLRVTIPRCRRVGPKLLNELVA